MKKIAEEDLSLLYDHTKDLWQKVNGKTIFVTGATGFFGKCLLQSFLYANSKLSLNARILALSRDPGLFISKYPEFNNSSIEFIKGNVRDFKTPEQTIDYIIHGATDVNADLDPLITYDTIVEGTRRVLELAKTKKTEAVLFISSGAVYGKQPSDISHLSEDYKGGPDVYTKDTAYGEGKRVAEMFCKIYHDQHGVNTKIARCYTFVGPYLPLDNHFAIGNFINNILSEDQIKIKGDGSPFRSYLYTTDLVIWLWQILFNGKPCYPYNVGSDEEINIEQLANTINSFSKNDLKVEVMQPKTNGLPSRYVPCIERAKKELGLSVYTNLKDAIERTIRFYTLENSK